MTGWMEWWVGGNGVVDGVVGGWWGGGWEDEWMKR